MSDTQRVVRIFISSPGDVVEERNQARRVIEGLQKRYPSVNLQPVLWEDLALPATASFQETIELILHQRPIDIAVFILWSRLGSPLSSRVSRPDGTPYRSGTEREFDLMLTAFEQSGQQRPVMLAYTRDDAAGFQQKLTLTPLNELEELLSQRKLAESFIREQFHDADGRNLRAYQTYREPVDFVGRLRTHLQQTLTDLLGTDAAPRWHEEPYRGLEVFDVRHADIFCGRDEETCDLLQRLRDQRRAGCAFAVIVGASGSGKSSLARAGVAATLLQHASDDGVKEWRTAFVLPAAAILPDNSISRGAQAPDDGTNPTELVSVETGLCATSETSVVQKPKNHRDKLGGVCVNVPHVRDSAFRPIPSGILAALARTLAETVPELRTSPTALDDIAAGLAQDAGLTIRLSITPAFARAAESAKGEVRLLLVIDQMEELWTDRRITPEDRDQFFAVIEALSRSGHITVLATLRSDFYPHAQQVEAFLRLKGERGHFDLSPPSAAALQRLIVEPARLAGLSFERHEQTNRSLDEIIWQDATNDPTVLPLLQYALRELYEQRDERSHTLTFAAYEQLGGVEGALGRRASATFHALPPEAQASLSTLLPHLVTIDVTGEQTAVRRRARLSALCFTDQASGAASAPRSHDDNTQSSHKHTGANNEHTGGLTPPRSPAQQVLVDALIAARFLTTDRQDDTPIVSLAHEALLRRWDELAQWITSNREHLRLRARVEHSQHRWASQGQHASLLLPSGLPLEEGQVLLREARPLLLAETTDYIERSLTHRQSESRRQRLIRTTALTMSLTAALIAILAALWITEAKTEVSNTKRDAALAEAQKARDAQQTAEKQQAAALRENADNYWRMAVNFRDSKDPDPIRASHLFLRGAKTLGQIVNNQFTDADKTFRRSEAHAAGAVDRRCVRTWAHDGAVIGCTFSRDESRVLTWSSDGTARLWDMTQPEPLQTFKHDGEVRGAQFSRDESRVLTWSGDPESEKSTAQLWDVTKPEPLQTFKHNFWVEGAQFSRNESRVLTWSGASSSDKGEAQLWDVTKPEPLQTFKHDVPVSGAQFSRDESRVLTWSWVRTARLWDVTKPEPLQTFNHDSGVVGAQFSRDGSRVLTWGGDSSSDKGEAKLWDVTQPEPLQTFKHDNRVEGVQFSRNESRVLTWSGDSSSDKGEAKLWDVTQPEPLQTFKHDGNVQGAQFSQDESRVLTWSDDYMTRLWDVTKPEPLQTFKHDGNVVYGAKFNRDESRVLTWSSDATARVWDVTKPEAVQTFKHDSFVFGAQFSRDESRVLTWSYDKTARLWDMTRPELLQTFKHDGEVNGAQFSRDESRVLTWSDDASSLDKGEARLWDVTKLEPLQTFKHDGGVRGAQFSRDESRVLTWSLDATARLWDVTKFEPIQIFRHDNFVNGAQFSRDESRVLTWGGDSSSDKGEAKLWDVTKPEPLQTFKHEGHVNGAQFSRDGLRVMTWSGDIESKKGEVRLWDVTKLEPLQTFKHEGNVHDAQFSRDESHVLTRSCENIGKTQLWDVTKPEPLQVFRHDDFVQGAQFSRDESRVLTWSEDKTARLWDVTKPEPLQTFQHDFCVRGAQFSRDESRVLTWSSDIESRKNGDVRLWNAVDPLAMLTPAERILELEVRSGTTLDANLKLRTLSFAEWQAKVKSPEYRAIEQKLPRPVVAGLLTEPPDPTEGLPDR